MNTNTMLVPRFIWLSMSMLRSLTFSVCKHLSHFRFLFLNTTTSLNTNTTTCSTRRRSEESTCFANWSYASLCTDANSGHRATQQNREIQRELASGNNKTLHDTISLLEEILEFFMRDLTTVFNAKACSRCSSWGDIKEKKKCRHSSKLYYRQLSS